MARFPEADFVRRSFTIRKMDFPPEVSMTKRSLLRWFALSFGLISPNESRSTVLDVLDGFFYFQVSKNYSPSTYELLEHLKGQQKRVDEKLLRYHLKRLIDVGLVERRKGRLSFVNAPDADPRDIVSCFNHGVAVPLNESVSSIAVALEKLGEKYAP